MAFHIPGNPVVHTDYYAGGVVMIYHAENVKISNSNFTQNDGWRTGGIWV
jgi:hypothetical protein